MPLSTKELKSQEVCSFETYYLTQMHNWDVVHLVHCGMGGVVKFFSRGPKVSLCLRGLIRAQVQVTHHGK